MKNLTICKAKSYENMSAKAAEIVLEQIKAKPDTLLGLATGSTPVGMYQELIEAHRTKDASFHRCVSVNLDEYAGLAPEHEQSYRYFMQENLFDHIDILPKNTHLPQGDVADFEAECHRYSKLLQELGTVDLQVLGLGHNGHIAFNEPATYFPTHTHLVDLDEQTIEANARFFESEQDVPRRALSMGLLEIFQAKHILLLVSGKEKAEILAKSFQETVEPSVPASILQFHPRVTLVGDEEALSMLGS